LKKSSIFSKRRWKFSPGGRGGGPSEIYCPGDVRYIAFEDSHSFKEKMEIQQWKRESSKGTIEGNIEGHQRREPAKGTSEGNQRREPSKGTIEGKGDAVHGSLLTAVEDKTSMTVMIRMMETRSDTQVVAVSHHTLGTLPTSGLPQAHSPASHAR
jgi:hypothetical protein